MNQELFDKEISMCRELSRKNGGRCNWGECAKCGAIPLLYKLSTGKIYDDQNEIEKIKRDILQ